MPYTAFEAEGQFVQFTCMPFDVTNGVSCFFKKTDQFILTNDLENTFAFLDKSVFSTTKVQILGSIVENGTIKPDPQLL